MFYLSFPLKATRCFRKAKNSSTRVRPVEEKRQKDAVLNAAVENSEAN